MRRSKQHKAQGAQQGLYKLMGVLLLGTLGFVLHIWLRTSVVTTSYEVEQARREHLRLENKFVELKALRERRLNPNRLEKIREKWADQGEIFSEARPEQVIFLKDSNAAEDEL
jgi:hypothetical protein